MKQVLRRELGSDKAWKRVTTVGYEAEDPKTRKLRTLESSMENLLLAQPEVLLEGLTGGLPVVVIPASTTPADYPRLSTRISYPTSCTSQR